MAQKRVIVYDLDQGFGMLPEYLGKRIEFLQKILGEIPEEHRETATIFQEANETQEGWPFMEYRISFWRPESEEEKILNAQLAKSAKVAKVLEDKETLAKLMKQYPVAVQINLNKEK